MVHMQEQDDVAHMREQDDVAHMPCRSKMMWHM